MQKQIRWLLAEIDRWVAEGIVSPEQAGKLRARYGKPESAVPWGLIVFATAGAIVIGLGVILLFAEHWNEIPKLGRLAMVLAAVIAAHGFAIRLLASEGWKPMLGEALSVLGTMLYGAGIWLVAQIYNIDEHYPNGFLFWALGALAMAWAIRSVPNGLLAAVLLVVWGCSETFDFDAPEYASILVIAVALVPLAWRMRSALLLAVAVIAIQFLVAANVTAWGLAAHAITSSLALSVLLVACSRFVGAKCEEFHNGAAVLEFLGFLAFVICGFILSFPDAAESLLDLSRGYAADEPVASVVTWLLSLCGVVAWAWLGVEGLLKRAIVMNREEWLLPAMLLQCMSIIIAGANDWALIASLSFNVALLAIAAMWMWRGCRESRLKPTILGSILLAAVVLARYFDLFDSFAVRGLMFIILGGILFAEALYYRKVKRGTGGDA